MSTLTSLPVSGLWIVCTASLTDQSSWVERVEVELEHHRASKMCWMYHFHLDIEVELIMVKSLNIEWALQSLALLMNRYTPPRDGRDCWRTILPGTFNISGNFTKLFLYAWLISSSDKDQTSDSSISCTICILTSISILHSHFSYLAISSYLDFIN